MAETGGRQDPFVAFRFEVKVDELTLGGFSSCTGLQLDTEFQDYAEGGLNTHIHKFPGRTRQTNLVLKRGVVDRRMWDWYFSLTQGEVRLRNGTVTVRDPAGVGVTMEWQFRRAYPAKWIGPELVAAQSAVAVETIEIVHQGTRATHLTGRSSSCQCTCKR